MFDLNEEISLWRKSFAQSDSMSATELDELESHLRDSFGELQVQLNNPAEAFWLATRRLGSSEEVGGEFLKIKPVTTWIRRAQWMLVGYLLLSFLLTMSNALQTGLARFAVYIGLPTWQTFFLCSATSTLCVVILVAWIWRAANGRSSGLQLVTNRYGGIARSGQQVWLVATVLFLFAIRLGSGWLSTPGQATGCRQVS